MGSPRICIIHFTHLEIIDIRMKDTDKWMEMKDKERMKMKERN
jgi:hypothetical protein